MDNELQISLEAIREQLQKAISLMEMTLGEPLSTTNKPYALSADAISTINDSIIKVGESFQQTVDAIERVPVFEYGPAVLVLLRHIVARWLIRIDQFIGFNSAFLNPDEDHENSNTRSLIEMDRDFRDSLKQLNYPL